MKITWGVRIAGLYISFVVMIVTLVAATFTKKPALVSDDYYFRETKFGEQLQARKAAAALGAAPVAKMAGDRLELCLPGGAGQREVRGLLRYYYPASPSKDRSEAFRSATGTLSFAQPVDTGTNCLLQIDWICAGTRYYAEIPAPWMR